MKSCQYIQQELDYLKRETENRSPELVMIFGEINFSVMINAIDIISEKLKNLGIKQAKITKAKLLTTELIQNVFKHGQKNKINDSYFAMYIDDESNIILHSGNVTDMKTFNLLSKALDSYSKKSKQEIKDLYVKSLRENELKENNNAGLGLITMFLRTDNNVKYSFSPANDNDIYYRIEIKITTK
jgi:hypothetical protein